LNSIADFLDLYYIYIMSSTLAKRTPKSGRQSLFFKDLASPISSRKGKFSTPGQAAAVSALWRENFSGSDLPPPPMYTLEDRSDFSPESGNQDYPTSPEVKSDPTSPFQNSGGGWDFVSPMKSKPDASSSSFVMPSGGGQYSQPPVSGNLSWMSPAKGGGGSTEKEEKGRGSPVEGVFQPGSLITLPPPREVARPEMKMSPLPAGNLDEEEWVIVYGFSPGDTNYVLREFEECGVILKHVPGPRGANWISILYQSRSDAQKALNKSGIQINGVLIIGVKQVDQIQRQTLNERLNTQGFSPLPPPSYSRTSDLNNGFKPSPRPYLQNSSTSARQSSGAIASPNKSIASKIMDIMFGY
jgi:nuclear pore complex protein Nup53